MSNGQSIQLAAKPRTERKGTALRELRSSGRIPAVVYGAGQEGIPVHVDAKEISRLGASDMIDLKIEGGETATVMVKDHQQRNGRLIHADFMRISQNKPIRLQVPLDFQGTAAGTKTGGVLQTQETTIEVEALPADLPNTIEVDISGLEVGDKLVAGDVKLPNGVQLIAAEDELLASIILPRAAELATDTDSGSAEEEAAPAAEEADSE
ncbi:50S ribosomal protein L25 [Paenibacillus sp. JX-17]|uniref:Large ribosomal subunit protein bL25 n=1 Tax=Paenibacillus lacisoli TaxID=3064525 RepID=A0ABT9CKK5_9BACL|nr:50S ribosomal protein L25 [Paenibacillus sp. JX-17]MDO7908158.1 50S ribosomal protein L25 [Paenibacillus sp. JX-17]